MRFQGRRPTRSQAADGEGARLRRVNLQGMARHAGPLGGEGRQVAEFRKQEIGLGDDQGHRPVQGRHCLGRQVILDDLLDLLFAA